MWFSLFLLMFYFLFPHLSSLVYLWHWAQAITRVVLGVVSPVKTGSASFCAELQIYAAEGKIGDDPLQSTMLTSNFSGTIHDAWCWDPLLKFLSFTSTRIFLCPPRSSLPSRTWFWPYWASTSPTTSCFPSTMFPQCSFRLLPVCPPSLFRSRCI